jgi:hypothetical protein
VINTYQQETSEFGGVKQIKLTSKVWAYKDILQISSPPVTLHSFLVGDTMTSVMKNQTNDIAIT